jgi:hypothetical protein
MANRSDFMSATLPRQIKKMMTLDGSIDSRELRMLWINAHAIAKRFKLRQNSSPAGRSASADDVPGAE